MAQAQDEVNQLRNQGLSDNIIMSELTQKGHRPEDVHMALSQLDSMAQGENEDMGMDMPNFEVPSMGASSIGSPSRGANMQNQGQGNIYERIEEITEGIISEKWDDLIAEVKKIIEWKENVEAAQRKVENDVAKLKEDFKTLHGGVLGKLETYDKRMGEVGTELHAVGKVFKDVIPQFVENVKELNHITGRIKKH